MRRGSRRSRTSRPRRRAAEQPGAERRRPCLARWRARRRDGLRDAPRRPRGRGDRRGAAHRHHRGARRLLSLPRRGVARLRRAPRRRRRAGQRANDAERRSGRPAPSRAVPRRPGRGRPRPAAHGPIPRARCAADLHLRSLPARRLAAGARGAGGVGRVERDRVLQLASSGRERTATATSSTSRPRSPGASRTPASIGPMRAAPRSSFAWPTTSPTRCAAATPSRRFSGIILGRRAGTAVAAIVGVPPGQSEDRLKAIAAAAASSGSVAMFHVVGLDAGGLDPDEATHGICGADRAR